MADPTQPNLSRIAGRVAVAQQLGFDDLATRAARFVDAALTALAMRVLARVDVAAGSADEEAVNEAATDELESVLDFLAGDGAPVVEQVPDLDDRIRDAIDSIGAGFGAVVLGTSNASFVASDGSEPGKRLGADASPPVSLDFTIPGGDIASEIRLESSRVLVLNARLVGPSGGGASVAFGVDLTFPKAGTVTIAAEPAYLDSGISQFVSVQARVGGSLVVFRSKPPGTQSFPEDTDEVLAVSANDTLRLNLIAAVSAGSASGTALRITFRP